MGKTIIVGNAPIKDQGKFIDSFDTVVRIKWSVLDPLISENYIDDIGKKIDILYTMKSFPTFEQMKALGKIETRLVDFVLKREWSQECDNYITNGTYMILHYLENSTENITLVGFSLHEDNNDYPHMLKGGIFNPGNHPHKGEKWNLTYDQNKKIEYDFINSKYKDRITWVL